MKAQLINKKHNLLILAALLFSGAFTYPSTQDLLQEWTKWDQAIGVGFACLALVVVFIWQLPFRNDSSKKTPSVIWVFLLGISSCGWMIAQFGNLQSPAYLTTFSLMILLLASCIDFQTFKKILPIFGLFIFALPIWPNQILVDLSSTIVSFILQFFHLTIHIEGNQILTPWGTIVIADGCSGLRYLVISLLLAYLLCLLNNYPTKTKIALVICAIILGLITNWIRISLLVLIGYHTKMTHSLMQDHELFGWILFAIIALPAIYFSPQKKPLTTVIPIKIRITIGILAVWISGPVMYFFTPFHPENNAIILNLDKDYARDWAKPGLFLHYPEADQINNQGISINKVPLHVEVMLLAAKHKDEKVVPYMGALYDSIKWRTLSTEKTATSNIEILEEKNTQQKLILAYQYQVGPWKTPDYIKAKLLQIPAKLTNQAYFGFWSAQAICDNDCTNQISAIKELSENW